MSTYDSSLEPPFDDSVQLADMQVDDTDDLPIVTAPVQNGERNVTSVNAADMPEVQMMASNGDQISKRRGYAIVAILFFINLLNYMDRFTIAGVLQSIQKYYGLKNSEDGLLQTSFISFYMVCSPVFGYMGDRYTRKIIMACGITFWAGVTLAGSFIPADSFWAFILLRGLVGVGEASYSTIAPTIIADLFSKDSRTKMLMIFYFAIPVGSGMGYIVGANVAEAFGQWQYALRVTPFLGVCCVVLILFIVKEPVRGAADGGEHLHNTSFFTDLKELVKNKSFMLSSFGFTCVAFTTGALALWAPIFMQDSITIQGQLTSESSVALTFGIITVIAGFLGVGLGAESSRRYKKINPRADPLICALGLLVCTPFLYFALVLSRYNTIATWILIFLGETALCLNWAIIADILLYTVIPTRRSAAESVQILMSHLLGDAGSPYLIGVVADAFSAKYEGNPSSPAIQYVALQQSLYITTFVCVLGGGFFLATALFIVQDKKAAERQVREVAMETGETNAGYDEVVDKEVEIPAKGL